MNYDDDIDAGLKIVRMKEIRDKLKAEEMKNNNNNVYREEYPREYETTAETEKERQQQAFFSSQIKKYRHYAIERKNTYKQLCSYSRAKEEIRAEALFALTSVVTGTICISIGQAENIGAGLDALREGCGFIFLFASSFSIIQFPSAIIAREKLKEIKEELFNREKGNHLKR